MTPQQDQRSDTLRTLALSAIEVAEGFNPRVDVEGSDVDELALGLEDAVVANQARKELDPIEEAKAFRRLIDAGKRGVAQELGVAQRLVTDRLAMLELPAELWGGCSSCIKTGHAVTLLGPGPSSPAARLLSSRPRWGVGSAVPAPVAGAVAVAVALPAEESLANGEGAYCAGSRLGRAATYLSVVVAANSVRHHGHMEDTEDLWARACEDAGVEEERVAVIVVSTRADDPTAFGAGYFSPAATAESPPVPLTAEEIRHVNSLRGRHRLTIPEQLEAPVKLGLMRWTLERAKQHDLNPYLLTMTDAVTAAFDPLTANKGAGGAVVWHAVPSIRDADLVAGHLVTKVFGPQTGRLWGPHGSLFRSDRQPGPITTLARRMVICAAVEAEAFLGLASTPSWPGTILRHMGEDWSEWWEVLLTDEDFTHLRRSSRYYVPEEWEIEKFEPNPAQAWRPLEHHLDITMRRGAQAIDDATRTSA